MQYFEIPGVRNEADLYGYSAWLAGFLNLKICPQSLRGFQHGWIWWDVVDNSKQGLDPNLDNYWGILVQDKQIETSLLKQKIFAKACGLPFLNYLEFSGIKKQHSKKGELLYVPTHSNPWNDVSADVLESAVKFSKTHKNASIMLSWSDKHLAKQLAPYFKNVEIGAGALEMTSFPRMATAFQSYNMMMTDSIGSHVLYAMACGLKVGIDVSLYYKYSETEASKKTIDYKRSLKNNGSLDFFDIDYLDNRFKGLVIDGTKPNYCIIPKFPIVHPKKIAELLGWPITYECEIVKQEN